MRYWLERRAAIEPVISHLEADHRMHRNRYLGEKGDAVNAKRRPETLGVSGETSAD